MTSPPRSIQIKCPTCGEEYEDWHRPSINMDLDDFDAEYIRRATTATCPKCETVVEIATLIIGPNGMRQRGE